LDGDGLFDDEGTVGCELVVGIESADALAGLENVGVVEEGQVDGGGTIALMVFDEALQFHI
jgi:hypothetical protein